MSSQQNVSDVSERENVRQMDKDEDGVIESVHFAIVSASSGW